MTGRRRILIVGLAVLFRAGPANADPPPGEITAETLFEQGRNAMRRGAYAEACPKFSESQRLDPSNGTLLNLILCEEKLGKVASAWLHAQELVTRLSPDDPRKAIAERRLATLAPRVPRLSVRLSPDAPHGTVVLLDDAELDSSWLQTSIPIDPGLHRLLVRAPNRVDRPFELSIEEGRTHEWLAEPGAEQRPEQTPPPPAAAPAPPAPRSPPLAPARSHAPQAASRTDSSNPPKWLGWSAGGLGAASLAASGVLLVMALDRKATMEENCPDKVCLLTPEGEPTPESEAGKEAADEGKRLVTAAIVTSAVGAVGLGFAIFTLTRSDNNARVDSHAAIAATPSSALVRYRVTF